MTRITKEEEEFIFDTLRLYLNDDMYVANSVAIYRHEDGHLSHFPFCGSPSIAADGSDEVIYEWHSGCYNDDDDPFENVDDLIDALREGFVREQEMAAEREWT
ncbi:hypothetical protein [Gimesia chilikensis]|uniref:Uncharacterized protein n=1 Tax=Gimesia chilikensis TaxID=2605989 RepID=A0A517PYC2_9PLAN|nr:hypothetical protein [Gimesia chilikensis]QDT24344.1 hypothetical protein HG66A1_61760 [Gimesia chilikensis]